MKNKPILKIVFIVVCLFLAGLGIKAAGIVGGFVGGAMDVVQQEFNPQEIQRKYLWFKQSHAALDAKDQNIKNILAMIDEVSAVPRDQRTEDDTFELRQNRTVLMGMKANFNKMASEYNANVSTWNWGYFDKGEYPGYKRFQSKFKPYQ